MCIIRFRSNIKENYKKNTFLFQQIEKRRKIIALLKFEHESLEEKTIFFILCVDNFWFYSI